MNYPREFDSNFSTVNISDDLGGKEMKNRRVQSVIKQSRNANISVFIINQDFYEPPKRTNRANGRV